MPSNLNYVMDKVGKDKGIDRKVIIEALEQAVLTASRKKYGHQGEIEVHYNEEVGEVELFQFKQVVEEVTNSSTEIYLEEERELVKRANMGRAEAVLFSKEQIPGESYRQGERLRAYILEVQKNSKGPQIFLSRTHPGFLIKLFDMEVPEISEGVIKIISGAP